MAWVRVGDTAALYPRVLAVAAIAPDMPGAVNELFGFITRLYIQSASQSTDYIVDIGTIQTIGQENWRALLAWAEQLGLLSRVEEAALPAYSLLDDPQFIHLRRSEEITADRNRGKDNRDMGLKAALLYRDGDNCRWCGRVVRWTGDISPNKGTLDHLDPASIRTPGHRSTVDKMVVACYSCNSARQANLESFQARHPDLLPVPEHPYYSKWSAGLISRHTAHQVEPTHASARLSLPIAAPTASGRAAERGIETGPVMPARPAPSGERRDAAAPVGVDPHASRVAADPPRSEPAPTAPSRRGNHGPHLQPARAPYIYESPTSDVDASDTPSAPGPRVEFANTSRTQRVACSNSPGREGKGRAGTDSGQGREGQGMARPNTSNRKRRSRGRRGARRERTPRE